MLFHAFPHVMAHDAYSGDYGLGFFGLSLEAGATLVLHPALGPLCYLCDLAPQPQPTAATATAETATATAETAAATATAAAAAAAAAAAETAWFPGDGPEVYTVLPRDAYRQRVYLEPLGLFLRADTGTFASVTLDRAARRVRVAFAPPAATAAGVRTYEVLRLRADKTARPEARRPGANFRLVSPLGVTRARGAWELPGAEGAVLAVLAYDI